VTGRTVTPFRDRCLLSCGSVYFLFFIFIYLIYIFYFLGGGNFSHYLIARTSWSFMYHLDDFVCGLRRKHKRRASGVEWRLVL
jgi:hypothetical protein